MEFFYGKYPNIFVRKHVNVSIKLGDGKKYLIKTTFSLFQVQLLKKELDNGRKYCFHVINR